MKVIDWNEPNNNDFFLASQFWISGDIYRCRADLVGFINGLPLIFIELKVTHKRLETAYTFLLQSSALYCDLRQNRKPMKP
ncbi:type I restriction endonuclease [Candidatus Uabimicrobium sp. HlEnr_7]|uniref:type I restriction endonuclease n=1 Tax=Candidatus Uabimicrobium helgolandensis TaxID=3095367 RepID=UPI00355699A5